MNSAGTRPGNASCGSGVKAGASNTNSAACPAPSAYSRRDVERGEHLLGQVVKRALVRAVVAFEILEEVIDDLAVVEADLRQLAPADLDDLVNVPRLPRVAIIHRRVL